MEVPTIVIKVKYQETIRRFSVRVTDDQIDLNVDQLWEKLHTLFNLAPNTELLLTYIDEDGDEVALVDDDDLRDVARQALDPLRVTVKLNSGKNGVQYCPSRSSTPLKSQCMQPPSQNCCRVLKTVPEPVYETVVKLSSDLASKASSSASGVTDLIDFFSKVGLTYLAHCSDSQHATQSDVTGSRAAARDTKNLEPAMAGQSVITESKVVRDEVGEKEKAIDQKTEKIGECQAKDKPFVTTSHLPPVENREWFIGKIGMESNSPTEKATNIRGSNLEPYPFSSSASDPIKVGHIRGRSLSPINFGNSTGPIWALYPGIPDMCSSPSPSDVPPMSRIPVENVSALQSHPASKAVISGGCNSRDVETFHIFHCGIFCDGCGVHPITGPRFKSKVEDDYDLCMICFAEMGNASDYIRIDHPEVYPHHVLYDSLARDRDPLSSQDCWSCKAKSCLPKMDSCFVKDVNIADDTVMAPLTPFTKIWRLKNNGILPWPKKTIIFWMGGDDMSYEFSVELKIPATGLAINQELDVAVDCIAPEIPGKYESFWRLASPSGQRFGQLIWIRIEVVASVAAKPQEDVRSCFLDLATIDVGRESIVQYHQYEQENTSVVSSPVPRATSPVPHPTFDEAPIFPSITSVVLHPFTPLPDMNLPASEDEGISFKSADLDEDAMSEDSLDLDYVSEVSEWDLVCTADAGLL